MVEIAHGCAAVATVVVLATFAAEPLYQRVRATASPWITNQARKGVGFVAWVQNHHQSNVWDTIHSLAGWTCGVEFYIAIIPVPFWIGNADLGLSVAMFMSLCTYFGNAIKDIVCAPRPQNIRAGGKNSPVRARSMTESEAHAEEYGFASTHTINTLCLSGYWTHYYYTHGGSPSGCALMAAVSGAWTMFIMYGRLVLGLHTPVDLLGGLAVALLLLAYFLTVDPPIKEWITSGNTWAVNLSCLVYSALQVCCYPRPPQPTPSYSYSVYFCGTIFGAVLALSDPRMYAYYSPDSAVMQALPTIGLTSDFAFFFTRRYLFGVVVLLLTRSLAKVLANVIVYGVLSRWIALENHKPLLEALATKSAEAPEKIRKRISASYNGNTLVRLFTYTVVGYVALAGVYFLMEMLGI